MYKPRIADRLLVRKLSGKGAVLIEGPKWCGKTTTARQQAKSLLDLGDTAAKPRNGAPRVNVGVGLLLIDNDFLFINNV